jgi:hypothetical protein
MTTHDSLAERLVHAIRAGSQRLYDHSFFDKLWLADYVADVDSLVDEYERLKVEFSEERQAFLAEQVAGQESRAELAEAQAELDGWRLNAQKSITRA